MSNNSYSHQRGLSLIELMVSITIGVLLLTGVVQIFAGSKSTYRTQEALSRVSENIRFALDILTQDISRANFWGCNTNITQVVNHLDPVDPANFIDFGSGGLQGTDGGPAGTDTITIRGMYGPPRSVEQVTDRDTNIVLNTPDTTLAQDMIVGLSDCRTTDIFQISAYTGNNTIDFNVGGAQPPGNIRALLSKGDYDRNASIYRAEQVTYSLLLDNTNGGNGRMALFRNRNNNSFPLINDVDDFQVVYGEDADNDDVVDRYAPAGTAGLNFANVISARITITLSSAADNVSQVERNLGNGVTDRRLARTFTTTIPIKNQLR
jgi:type IV pilus assembly protein PilW